MSDSPANHSKQWLLIAGLTLLAPATGGATQLWAEALLLLCTGAAFIAAPPRKSLGLLWNLIFLGLGALALTAFLPAGWPSLPEWRHTLAEQFSARLPETRSPQPWISLEDCGIYFCGLSWAYYLLTQAWTRAERHAAVRFYGIGVALLAAISLGVYLTNTKVPFWPLVLNSPINFGFFPNRNQTANVLALGSIMMTAVTFEASERMGKRGLLWFPAVLLICFALVVDYSRAGVVLFFGGAAAWLAITIPTSRSRRTGALCLAAMVLMLAAFLLFGGDTLRRFQPEPKDNARQWTDFRFSLQEDAVALVSQTPVVGQGLGSFTYLFPLYREKSAGQNWALHPESDWLWMAAELGWTSVVLVLAGIGYWLSQCFPFQRKTDRRLRSAAAVCGAAFALHGLADVSGHRAGAAWPALFLMSIALSSSRRRTESRMSAPIFRFLGVLLIGLGSWWMISEFRPWTDESAPTSQTLVRLKAKSEGALAEKDYAQMIEITTEALRIAPLDWRLYFQRGVARAASHNSTAGAKKDFALARYLVPQWAESCFLEGRLWLSLDEPDLALDAWKEALARSGADAPHLYERMLSDRPLNIAIRADLEELARSNREYWLVFLDFANGLECDLQIGELLAEDPALLSLTPAQRRALFAAWFRRGNRSLLISSLLAYPAWLPEGWPWVAQDYVEKKDFRDAYELAMRFTVSPALPVIDTSRPIAELERNFFFHADDIQAGIALFLAQRKLGRTNDAVHTLLALKKIPKRPAYLSFLEAQMYAERGEWDKAWNARLEFGPLTAR